MSPLLSWDFSAQGLNILDRGDILAPMKTKRKTGKPRGRPSADNLRGIPAWSKLGQIDFPEAAMSRVAGDKRFSAATEPRAVLEALLVTLWLDLGHIERRKKFPKSCPPSSLSRTLRAWTQDVADPDGILRTIWRRYLSLLTKTQVKEWRKRLQAQHDSWHNWDQASRLASRVHSPWFHVIWDETIRDR